MPLQTIPIEWCQAVRSALPLARFTHDCHLRFQNDFPGGWRFDLEEALRKTLASFPLQGCPVRMAEPPGETWEFFFVLLGTRTYGKILLRSGSRSVVIFSAHRPRKSKLRCE
jgi:hypothetical protein